MTQAVKSLTQIDLPPEAVDRVYALSLFELAEAHGGVARLEEIADEMEQLAETTRADAQTSEFFSSRIVTGADKARVLTSSLKGRISDLHLTFMLLLVKRERLDRYRRICTAFDQLMQDRFGKVEVDIFTRYPLDRSEVDAIRGKLQVAMKREPVLHAYTDDSMIGGMKLQIGDQLLDATIDAQLRRMRELLLQQGAGSLRARMERIIKD